MKDTRDQYKKFGMFGILLCGGMILYGAFTISPYNWSSGVLVMVPALVCGCILAREGII